MRKRGRTITIEDVKFVYENYANMSASEIAEKLGISKFQVNKIVNELRKRGVNIPKKIGKKVNVYDRFVEELKKKGKL
ncbi:MAG: MarR family transcriptional regulator [Thermodesulfobacterium sp.]|uniref:Biotin operon repressor n=1 Tax=Candidatus Thermodesulfobacterium syntrophicum TaxID=3060442 RepID=A0AAE3P3I1_9BACT|nr:MarR family transcriptional regulator [Thermodesulfobacterium sp.]MCD6548001.1 MarR family transcriptional regulator [Thermodesulfobacterium sp.]MDF2953025.1 Biotin operon repressor [Candidatus Thermodesulfobacterium syntrophicum]